LGFESLPGSENRPAHALAWRGVNGSLPGYLARRFALLALTLVVVPSLSFVMFTLIQGDNTAPLDLLDQLAAYLSATFLQGNFGGEHFHYDTFVRTRSAFEVVKDGFLVDCYLLGGAIILAVTIGLLAGTLQATRPRSGPARVISIGTAFVLSSPVYWLGLMLVLLFAPGVGSVVEIPFFSTVGGYRDPSVDLPRFLQGIWLPCLIVGAPLAAACTRMAAAQVGGTLEEDFVRTARGKGLGERRVVWRHVLPAAAAPVIALIGVNMNLILTNLALIEVVFNIPGSFRYIERALINRDVDLVQALVFESTFFIVVANFASDAIQGWLDPRVRTGAAVA
jgi:ABC-type dipeptide/oligopeptide/nickel transport system permease component